ncbi:transmembrane epididymal protein [Perilla frutescens var. hirtella]|nr:transmembrane epididymal protein [Perilla frutescens var. hirtella]
MGVLPKIETWNCMFSLFLRSDEIGIVWGLYGKIIRLGISSNVFTLNMMINLLSKEGNLKKAEDLGDFNCAYTILLRMNAKDIEPDSYACGSLMGWMCKCGKIGEASELLREMEENGAGEVEKAFRLHGEMVSKGIEPTRVTYTSRIHLLVNLKRMKDADALLAMVLGKGVMLDLVMFNTLIDGYCDNVNFECALSLLKEMERIKINPDTVTYNSIMQGYCGVGKVEEAHFFLGVMSKRGGLCEVGEGNHAEAFLKEMVYKGITPDDSTYISLIKGCTRACKENVPGFPSSLEVEFKLLTPAPLSVKKISPECSLEMAEYYEDHLVLKLKQETSMGTFLGHLVPGLALASLGLWHLANTLRVYFLKGSGKFTLRFWYPLRCPLWILEHLELILVLSFSLFSILIQILDIRHLHFFFKLDSAEHATMFFQLVIFTSFTLFSELSHLSENVLGVSCVLVASIFGQELFLLHYHSTDHVGLEGHYHWLMQLIVCVSFLAALYATAAPSSFPAALILSISVVFQGCWFINTGFMLWVPDFVPQGCTAQPMHHSNSMMHGAVVCETDEADSRARALANLQFCWILSSILVFMAAICIAFGRQATGRRQSLDYEQLASPGAHDTLATVGLKQIQL